MKYRVPDQVAEYTKAYQKKKRWQRVVTVLAAVVVFFTTYALILPAITLEKKNRVLECPVSIHQHTENCYDEAGSLICGQADFIIHTHTDDCYDAEENLVCELPEIEAHEHNDSCYQEERVLVCTLEESEEHQHTADCYTKEQGNLICTNEDSAHEHTDDCYEWNEVMICGQEEGDGSHTHIDECYEITKVLTCDNLAVPHKHSQSCYDDSDSLTCGQLEVSEHQHEEGCFVLEENGDAETLPEEADGEEKLLTAPYGAVLSAWAEVEETQAIHPVSHGMVAAPASGPQEKNSTDPADPQTGASANLAPHLTVAKIQVDDKDYDGSALDRNSPFSVFLQAGISNNELSYQYKIPNQIVVKNTGSAEQPIALMADDTQIGTYYIQDNTVYINYVQSYTGVTTNLELSASWSDDVKDHETINWGNGNTTDVKFINEDIVIQKSDTNNGMMQIAENGDLYAEYIIQAMLTDGGKLKISDELTENGNGIVGLWRGAYENGTADYEWSIHKYSGDPKNPDAGLVEGKIGYEKFSSVNNAATAFSIENNNFDLEKNQYVEIKYKVKVDVNDRLSLDGYKKKLNVENKATATSVDDLNITSSMIHNVIYQAASSWVQKSNTNTSADSNVDDTWMITINAQRSYDMEGTVVMDNVSSEGTTYNIGEGDFTATITGANEASETRKLKVINISDIESILAQNQFSVDILESYIAYELGGSQSIEEMDRKIGEFQYIFQRLLGVDVGQTVDAALLSQYVFVDNRNVTKALTKESGPLFLWIAPPDNSVSGAGSAPYSYILNYSTHSEDGTTAVINQAAANWKSIVGGTGPITTFQQQIEIDKSNNGVYTGTDGNLYVDWNINLTVPANSAAIKDVWLVDLLPSATVKVAGQDQATYPSLVGMSSYELNGAFLKNHADDFGGQNSDLDKDSEIFKYLHSLVENVFTFTGSGEDVNAAQTIVANAYPILGATGYSVDENFARYSGLAERLGTMDLTGYEEEKKSSPTVFSIRFGDLPATEKGYTITVNYTTQVNPHTMPLATQEYVQGTNTAHLYSNLGNNKYTKLGEVDSTYWLAKQSAQDSVVKNIVGFDPTKGILTYRVELDPLHNLNVGHMAYQIHDSLSRCPGATYIDDSFKLYVHAGHSGDSIHNWIWNYKPGVEQLIWASNPNVFDEYEEDSFEKLMYKFLIDSDKDTNLKPVVCQLSNDSSGSSNFYLTLNNIGWMATAEGRFVPLTLEYQVQLPENTAPEARYIDNEVLFSAYYFNNPSNIALIGASYASFDTQNIMHKVLYQTPNIQNNYMAGFQININRYESENLMNAKEIAVRDELSDTLRLVVSSVKLEGKNQDGADWTKIPSEDWRLRQDEGGFDVTIYTDTENGNTVYEQYRLTYLTKVLGDSETTVHYSNKAAIQSLGITSETIERNVFFQDVSAGGSIFNLGITVLKVDGNDMTKQLEGVSFELYTFSSEDSNEKWVKQETTEALTTSKDGKIQLTNTENGVSLRYNTWYALKEIEPKKGYLSIKPVYFYIPQTNTAPPMEPPKGVDGEQFIPGQPVKHAGELTIENITPSFTLEKRDAKTGDLIYDAGFTLYSHLNCTDSDCNHIVKALESSTSGSFTFENLELGKIYYLKETKVPVGYMNPEAVYQVSVDDNGNVTIKKLDENGRPVDSSEIQQKTGQSAVFVAYNTPVAYELPESGGIGTVPFTVEGILLSVVAGIFLLYRIKRRKEDFTSF